ncbi:MAG: hypothetical protein M0D55_05330 [Elusimicrobiota bacterium]|nr:MAG: hypothetical protein M0D55_05330 [Elusimicrobiota bacterium]
MRPGFSALAVLLFAACSTPASRIKRDPGLFASWPAATQEKVRAGQVEVGFSEEMARMALGAPTRRFSRESAAGRQEVWVYGDSGSRPGLGVSIGGGTFGGSTGMGGGVSVGTASPGPGERARLVFEGGRVVSVEKLER